MFRWDYSPEQALECEEGVRDLLGIHSVCDILVSVFPFYSGNISITGGTVYNLCLSVQPAFCSNVVLKCSRFRA